MSARIREVCAGLARVVLLVFLAGLGTITLVRFAPGYFTDSREMDAQYAAGARSTLEVEEQHGSMMALTRTLMGGWMRGDLGTSRQYAVPVTQLIAARVRTTARLLAKSIGLGWFIAFALALPLSAPRGRNLEGLVAAPSAILLAIPVGVMAMVCMSSDVGGPLLVLTLIIAARDFKFAYRLLRQAWTAPHLLYAKAQGVTSYNIAFRHLVPSLKTEMFGLAMMSLVLALSAIVPVEVIFDLPGLGQLAWSAAMNRDLPVLLAVTLLMATCIGVASVFTQPQSRTEANLCA